MFFMLGNVVNDAVRVTIEFVFQGQLLGCVINQSSGHTSGISKILTS